MRMSKESRWVIDEETRGGKLRQNFLDAYNVKQYKFATRNFRWLLLQGGARDVDVKRVLKDCFKTMPIDTWLSDSYGKGDVFDHYEFYGRGKTPLFLIGHPYNISIEREYISDDAKFTIESIRSLGVTVQVLGKPHSWYGFGTAHVAVYHWPTVQSICGDTPPYCFCSDPIQEEEYMS